MANKFANDNSSVLGRISSLLSEINGEKRASELGLSGSASQDPGGYMGSSSHPSAKADNMTQSTPMGGRAKENEKDVKKTVPGPAVDSVSPDSGKNQDEKQINVGTNQSSTGEDSSVEDSYKGDKDDPGTDHPADATNTGEKYSSMRFDTLTKLAFSKMNAVLAEIANGNGSTKSASSKKNITKEAQVEYVKMAATAGYELADMIGKSFQKSAQENQAYEQQLIREKKAFIENLTHETIKDAQADADNVGSWLLKYATEKQRMLKAALDEEAMAAGLPPMAEGGGGGEMPPEMGGGEMPPEMGGGEMSPEMGGGAPSGGGEEEAVNELVNALIEAGIPPEALLEAAQEEAPAAGGEGLPMPIEGDAGAMDAGKTASYRNRRRMDRQTRSQLTKLASLAIRHKKSGRLRLKEAAPGTQRRKERDEIINYVREVCSR